MPKKIKILIITIIILLVVFSLIISPSETTPGYTFVESVSIKKIFYESLFWTEVLPLDEGEWVVLSGEFGILLPQWKKVGGGNKCYVVGIEGPTNRSYTIISFFSFVAVASSDWSWAGPFEENFLEEQDFERNEEHCSDGLTVFSLPVH